MLGESHPTGCQLRFLNQNLAWNSKATWGNIKRLVWLLSCNSSSQSDQRSLGGPENFTGILWGQTVLLLPRGHLHFSLVNTGLHCSWSKTRSPLAQGKAVEANWICSPLLHHSGKIQSKPTEELPWWSEIYCLAPAGTGSSTALWGNGRTHAHFCCLLKCFCTTEWSAGVATSFTHLKDLLTDQLVLQAYLGDTFQ